MPRQSLHAMGASSPRLPPLAELAQGRALSTVRLPDARDIALTPRVVAVIDHPAFQRLRHVRQLGPTSLVYPGAVHTRFEHSLGVYGATCQFLEALGRHEAFAQSAREQDLLAVLGAALVHDLGHYPFAHSLEALHIKGQETPRHEEVGAAIVRGQMPALCGPRPLCAVFEKDWGVDPERILALCTGQLGPAPSQMDRILRSILSGAIDADKMDYLERDSHHMGVPYGRNYDRERLLASLTLNAGEDAVALWSKGRVPGEMFIFSRYTMFSEAYWHHTVRSVAAMVEAALADFQARAPMSPEALLQGLLGGDDDAVLRWMLAHTPEDSATHRLVRGLVGYERRLYKRIATFSRSFEEAEKREAYARLYAMQAQELLALREVLAERLGRHIGRTVAPAEIIVDTPPRDKDRMDSIEIVYGPDAPGKRHYPLHEVSQIVSGIQSDFVSVVKKVRIFASPELAAALPAPAKVHALVLEAIWESVAS